VRNWFEISLSWPYSTDGQTIFAMETSSICYLYINNMFNDLCPSHLVMEGTGTETDVNEYTCKVTSRN